jgi:pyrimidine operon attenuation protein / uracil phosphoribosyltransferase
MHPNEPLPDAEAQCRQLADLIRPQLGKNPALVGIYSGGAWIAERLNELLGLRGNRPDRCFLLSR